MPARVARHADVTCLVSSDQRFLENGWRQEAERERSERVQQHQRDIENHARRDAELDAIHEALAALTVAADPWQRGIKFEDGANRLFAAFGISVRTAFKRIGELDEGIVE